MVVFLIFIFIYKLGYLCLKIIEMKIIWVNPKAIKLNIRVSNSGFSIGKNTIAEYDSGDTSTETYGDDIFYKEFLVDKKPSERSQAHAIGLNN